LWHSHSWLCSSYKGKQQLTHPSRPL
jgi:hypothetical protein